MEVNVISDIVSYWLSQDKHLLIVGGTGAGKSTFIQAFASVLGIGWSYKVYDTDCTVDDWLYLRSLPTCAMYESFASIGEQMQADIETIETRTVERKQAGNKWTTDNTLIVAEELPMLVDELENAGVWLSRHAKRGRRVKRFVAVVVQNDTVKNTALADWLRAGGKQVCLVDDKPALRPTTVQTWFTPTDQFTLSLPVKTAESFTESQCSQVHERSEDSKSDQKTKRTNPI